MDERRYYDDVNMSLSHPYNMSMYHHQHHNPGINNYAQQQYDPYFEQSLFPMPHQMQQQANQNRYEQGSNKSDRDYEREQYDVELRRRARELEERVNNLSLNKFNYEHLIDEERSKWSRCKFRIGKIFK